MMRAFVDVMVRQVLLPNWQEVVFVLFVIWLFHLVYIHFK